jgi:hypothetical protein
MVAPVVVGATGPGAAADVGPVGDDPPPHATRATEVAREKSNLRLRIGCRSVNTSESTIATAVP